MHLLETKTEAILKLQMAISSAMITKATDALCFFLTWTT